MPTPFTRSMRSLELDSCRTTLGALLVAAVLLFSWLAWFVFAEVSLYAVTDTARLEVGQEAHPVEAPVSGRVIGTHLELGPTGGNRLLPCQSRLECNIAAFEIVSEIDG